MSWMKTLALMIVMSVLVVLMGGIIGGATGNFLPGLVIALIFSFGMNFAMYWFSDKLALRMAGAKQVTEQEEPRLHFIVSEVARMGGLPKPKVYVIHQDSPNAFATGRNPQHAVVAVTDGLRRILNEEELKGVIAHEMGHVKNRDMLIMTMVAALAATITFLAQMAMWGMLFGGGRRDGRDSGGNMLGIVALVLAMVLMPLAATMVRMAISRTREYAADETGARMIHNPHALASALEKLEAAVHVRAMPATQRNQAMAHMYIVNPLGAASQHKGESNSQFMNLFMTHPPMQERVRRLRAMAGSI